jgi:putative ABC transport system permease protein
MTFWNDLRFAGRMLRKSPGFAITAVVTMALGCGATTAVFSVSDAMLWKPVPLPDLASLVMILQQEPGNPHDFAPTTPGDTADLRRELNSLTGLTSWEEGLANLVGAAGEPERVSQYLVTSNFFDVIGVRMALGRGFLPGEDQPGKHREVVLSDAVWRRRFGADPNLVGRTIRLDDEDFLVVGITAPKFAFPKAAEVWTPLALNPEDGASRRRQILMSAGRLKPGLTIQQLSADLIGVGRRLEERYPTTNHKRRFMAWSAHRFLIGEYNRQYLTMLLGSVLFVLLIACVNVANLQFARATGRLREVAVRSALGAGRGQIVAQLITESLLLSLAGAGLGLLLAAWGLDLIRAGMPPEVEKYIVGWKEIQLDARAMLFTLTAAIGSGFLAGLAPAWQSSRPNLVDALRDGGRGSSAGNSRNRMRNFLVAAEVALAVVLLVGASLMVRGFNATIRAGQNLQPKSLLTLRLALTESRYHVPQRIAFYEDVLGRLNAIPSVQSAVAAVAMPCSDHSSWRSFSVAGRPVDPAAVPSANYQAVTPRYFETLHVPLLAGRFLDARDGRNAPRVAVISRRLAQRYWPNEPFPLGQRIRIGAPEQKLDEEPWITIVGVVGDVLHDVYDRDPRPVLYVPYPQDPWLWMDIGIRTAGDPNRIVSAARAAIAAVDPSQPVCSVATLETLIHNQALGLIYVAVLMAVFGGLALLLSCVGVYGVMAYMVQEQTHEIGIRVALGAPRENVLAMVFRRGMLTTAAGLAFGLAASYALALMMQHLIQNVSATDPLTFTGIPLVLLAAAALAIFIPARRAMGIDPIIALRYE